jgi:hypothetical protein
MGASGADRAAGSASHDAAGETLLSAGWSKLTDAQRADIEAHVNGLTFEAETYSAPEHGWTCFHCGETFKTYGGARLHFGGYVTARPTCSGDVIKDVIRNNVQLEWKRDPGGGGGYGFIEKSLEQAVRLILKASDASPPAESGDAVGQRPSAGNREDGPAG